MVNLFLCAVDEFHDDSNLILGCKRMLKKTVQTVQELKILPNIFVHLYIYT